METGTALASVELAAFLTRIFSEFSVELITDCDTNASGGIRSVRREGREGGSRRWTANGTRVCYELAYDWGGGVPVRFIRRDDP